MKLGINGRTFGDDHALDADILVAAVNGFASLDILVSKLERYLAQPEFDIRDLTRLFLRTKPGALDGLVGVDFSDGARNALLERAEHLFKQARRVGAPTVILYPAEKLHSDEESVDGLTALAALAQRWSIRLAVAPAPRAQGPLASYATLAPLVTRVGGESLGLLVDTVLLAYQQALELLRDVPAGLIAHVHLADSAADGSGARVLPGEGQLPLASILAAVAATGYDGIVSVALDPGAVPGAPIEVARAAHAALNALFESAGIRAT